MKTRSELQLSQLEPKPSLWLAVYRKEINELSLISKSGFPWEAYDRDFKVRVIFDGILFNRIEKIKEIGKNIPLSASNAEIILQGYLKWGEEVKNKIRGSYAFLIADKFNEILYCIRDRMGRYPFFLLICRNRCIFRQP